eukprot:4370436-Prymnesium_polylepis.2
MHRKFRSAVATLLQPLLEVLPRRAEEGRLHAIGEEARRQTAPEEPAPAVGLDDRMHRVRVRDGQLARLTKRLNDSERVGHRVGDRARAEAEAGVAREGERQAWLRRHSRIERVVRPAAARRALRPRRVTGRDAERGRARERPRQSETERRFARAHSHPYQK